MLQLCDLVPETTKTTIRESIHAARKDWAFIEALQLPVAELKDRSAVFQCDVPVGGAQIPAFVKVYASKKHSLQRYLRPSRSRQEARNLLYFRELGITTPRVLAWGEHRNFCGKVTKDFIITEAQEEAIPMESYLRQNEVSLKRRIKMAKTLGTWMSRIHATGFYHKDIHWRNILVRRRNAQEELFWIDCPRGRFHRLPPVRRHWQIKDCAILDKYASVLCSRKERLAFLSAYMGQSHEAAAVTDMAETISAFRKKRYDQRPGRSQVKPLEAQS